MARTAEVVFIGDAASIVRAAQEASAATEGTAGKIDASSARIAKANEAAAKSATKMARDFALAGVGVIAASVDMAVKAEAATASIAKSAGTSAAAAKKIELSFRGLQGAEYSGTKVAEAFSTVAGELKVVEGHALGVEKATKFMTAALDLTDATGGKLTGTTEALGKVMLTYGLHANEAAKASDILFNASKQTGTTVESLAQVIDRMRGRLGALAPSLGETAGLMEEFAKKGITGRQSLSALNGVFSTLLGGSKATTAVAKELGLQLFDQQGKFVGLKNVISQLNQTLPKYNQETQLAYSKALFGAAANKQLLEVIHQGPAAFDAARTAVEKHGAAAKAAAKEHQTLEGKLKIARAAAENLGAALGEKLIPDLTAVIEAVEGVVKWLGKHQAAAETLAKVVEITLGGALTVYAYTKAAAFLSATKDMVGAVRGLAATMGLVPTAAEAASAKTIAAQTTTTDFIVSSDGTIVAANEAAGASFTAMLGPIAAVVLALAAAEPFINKLTGGGLGESASMDKNAGKYFEDHAGKGGPSASIVDKYGSIAERASARYGISANILLADIEQETGGKEETSSAGARGITQFLPSTASKYGVKFGTSKADVESQIMGQAAYLKALGGQKNIKAALEGYFTGTPGSSAGLEYAESVLAKAGTAHNKRIAKEVGQSVSQEAAEAEKAIREAQKHSGSYGNTKGPSVESLLEKSKKAKSEAASVSQIDKWAEAAVGHFAESWGKNQGPELNKLQAEFHTNAAAWCAEFATTAAMFGGASKAVRTASVASIREWAQAGSHGYQKGLSSAPKAGDLMLFGDSHVGFVQSVDKTSGTVTTIEGNTNKGNGAVTRVTHKIGEGEYAVPTYKKLQGGAGEGASALKEFEAAAKAHLMLSPAQEAMAHSLSLEASAAHASAAAFGGLAGGVAETWQRARGVQEAKRKSLGTAQGAHEAGLIDKQDVLTAEAQKKLYQRAVRELQAEVKALQKLRKQYLSLASHAHGNAKKEALKKAAEYSGRIGQAQEEAKAYGGHIADSEAAIETAQNALTTQLPGEIGAADLSAYQAANNKIDAEARAGLLVLGGSREENETAARTAKEGNARAAEGGAYGALTPEGLLQVKGDLKEFSEATTNATDALKAHTEALEASAKALAEFAHIADAIGVVEAGSFAKSLADTVNGQIGGIASGRRVATVGSGSAARY